MSGRGRRGHTPHDERVRLIEKAEEHHRRYLELQEERRSLYPIIEAAVAECEQTHTSADSGEDSPAVVEDLPMLKHELEDLEMEAPVTEFVDSARLSSPRDRTSVPDQVTGDNSLLRRLAAAERQLAKCEAARQDALAQLSNAEEREEALLSRQAVMEEAISYDRARRIHDAKNRRTRKRSVMAALQDGSLVLDIEAAAPRRPPPEEGATPTPRIVSQRFSNSRTVSPARGGPGSLPSDSPRSVSSAGLVRTLSSPGISPRGRSLSLGLEKEPDDGSLRLGRNRARSELDLLSPRPDPGDLSPTSPFDIRLDIRKPEPSPGVSPAGTPGASPIGTPSSAAATEQDKPDRSNGLELELVPGAEPQPEPEPEGAEDADLMHTVSLEEMKPGHHHGHGHHKPPQTGPVKVGPTMTIHLQFNSPLLVL